MDIPLWAWALGFLAIIAVIEHFSEKKDRLSGVESKNTNSADDLDRISGSTLDSVDPTVIPRNPWDGDINGRTVAQGSSWDLLRKDVLSRDSYRCTNCGSRSNLTVDHKVPLSLGGTNIMSNLATLCKDCHEHKDQRKIFDKAFDAKDDYGKDHRLTRKVEVLSRAINSGSRVTIVYTDYKGNKTSRIISPRRLAKDKGRIYCIAYCHLRNDRRTFRLSRLEV
ncbi:MAG: WYL domain-containing protein [Candidatus Nomurabacteria bacterium]|nr:MAG: WYL domain-containing protein [Candidatus Nomurabacteria bacterium]